MLVVRLLVNRRLLLINFEGSQKLYVGFQLWGLVSLTPALFKGHLYSVCVCVCVFPPVFLVPSSLPFHFFW